MFSDDAARAQLNAIVHPRVRALAAEREKAARPHQLLVHVVPLLFETGYGDTLDRSIVVVASDANRIARVTERDRVDEARVRARMAAQIEPEKARSLADYVIVNDADLAHLQTRTRQVYDALVA